MSRFHPDCLSADTLAALSGGRLGERAAAAAAIHLDACPACANRLAAADPLGPFFAAVDDPAPIPAITPGRVEAIRWRGPALAVVALVAAAALVAPELAAGALPVARPVAPGAAVVWVAGAALWAAFALWPREVAR
jgi:anti-sigma factor RsiW